MKKLFIIGLGLTMSSLALTANAQQSQAAANDQIRFGIRAGANLMNMGKISIANQNYSTDSKVGFQAGVYADLPLGGGFAFLPEVMYSQKGGKVKETFAGNTAEFDSKVGYLDVPILIGFRPSPELTIFAGPQASFLLSQESSFKVNGEQVGDSFTNKKDYKKSIAGGVVGVGYNITPNINLNGRYAMDFQKSFNDDVNQDKLKNKGFALSLGYTF